MKFILLLARIILLFYFIRLVIRVFLFYLLHSKASNKNRGKSPQSNKNVIDAEYKEV